MRKKILYTLLSLLLFSCSKEEENNPNTEQSAESNENFWSLSQNETTVSSNQTEIKLNLESNISWEVISKPDWVSIQPDKGEGNAELKITINENSGTTNREAQIVFESEIAQSSLKILQESTPLKLVSYSGSESPIQLSKPKYFLFNKPIQVNYIKSGDDSYSFSIAANDMEYFDNNRGVKFNGGPSVLGNTHSYEFSVKDSDGNILKDSRNLNFYSQKILIPGFIKDVIFDNDKILWVLSVQTYLQEKPSYIIKYRIEDRSLIEEFRFEIGIDGSNEFSYKPGAFCINPYNDLIYVTNPLQSKIEVYNKSGNLLKEISKTGLTITDAIVFLKSGIGIFTGQLDNQGRWLLIDSSENDQISLPIDNPNFNNSFKTFVLNYDRSKAYVLGNRSPIFKIFDETGHFKEINMKDLYPNGADAVRITQNKLNNNIYVAGLYNQQIIKPDFSFLSKQSYAKFFIGDFSYDPDQSNHIFALTGATGNSVRFKLLDYNNQTTKMEHRINHNFSLGGYPGVVTSPDNDLIILYTDRYDNTSKRSQIVVFDTEMFQ